MFQILYAYSLELALVLTIREFLRYKGEILINSRPVYKICHKF